MNKTLRQLVAEWVMSAEELRHWASGQRVIGNALGRALAQARIYEQVAAELQGYIDVKGE
jgi:hypothetical protein